MSFFGTTPVRLDDKNRIAIPLKIRAQFEPAPVYLTLAKARCIALYTQVPFEERVAIYKSRAPESDEAGWELRNFTRRTEILAPDGQGRIIVPPGHLAHANISRDRETVLIGVDDHLELWDAETLNQDDPSQREVA
jgi:division/cell wall cluster transcriptional repressor MraZ